MATKRKRAPANRWAKEKLYLLACAKTRVDAAGAMLRDAVTDLHSAEADDLAVDTSVALKKALEAVAAITERVREKL